MRTSSGTILLAFIAILMGLMGVYALRKLSNRQPAPEAAQRPSSVTVPLAAMDLKVGRTITMGDIALMKMTRSQMKERGVQGPFMATPQQIIGRTLNVDLARGATFDTVHFLPEGERHGISNQLQPGQRAVTVSVTNNNALLGFAGAGQLVDVLFQTGDLLGYNQSSDARRRAQYQSGRGSSYGGGQQSAALTLMQGVKVLALEENAIATTGPTSNGNGDAYVRVTLSVSPEQAEVLRVVQGHGEMSLTLRHPDDRATVDLVDPRTLEEVLHLEVTRRRGMEVYRGQRLRKIHFDYTSDLSRRIEESPTDDAPASLDSSEPNPATEADSLRTALQRQLTN